MPSIVRACANKCTQFAPLICCAEAALYPPPLPLAGEGREGDRSPSGASPRLLLRRPNATAQPRAALPGITGCERVLPLPGPVQRAPRRPVVVPAGRGPEAARARTVSFRARAPHLAPLSGVPSRRRPWRARWCRVTDLDVIVKRIGLRIRDFISRSIEIILDTTRYFNNH